MKRFLIALAFIAAVLGVKAQQSPLYTQYMHNPFVLNPAIAGTYNFYQVRMVNRFQWAGFTDAPVTNSLSAFGPFSGKNKDMGIGGTIYNDITGPTSRLGIRGAYAYNMAISEDKRISFGATLGILQFKYDGTQIKFQNNSIEDRSAPKVVKNFYKPDAMLGVYFYSTLFQAGISCDNLFNSEIKIDNDNNAMAIGKLKRHFYLLGTYNYIINRRWWLEGSTVIKAIMPAPLQVDLNVRAIYQKMAWGGISFRSSDAISIMGGYIFNKRILAGYSCDFTISPIRSYSFFSHELMLGYKFNPLK